MGLIESKSQLVTIERVWTGQSFETTKNTNLFVADRPYQVVSVTERHAVIGSCTVMLVGALGSTPLGSATPLLASTIDLTATVDVFRSGTLLGSAVLTTSSPLGSTAIGPVLAQGDGLGLLYSVASNIPPVGVLTVVLQTI